MLVLVRRFSLFFPVCILLFSSPVPAAPSEQQVKAAYLYQLSRLTTWPNGKVTRNINICITDESGIGEALKPIHNRKSHGRNIQIQLIDKTHPPNSCHILYAGKIAPGTVKLFNQTLATQHILVVGDQADFVRLGGMIGFTIKSGKVRLNINLQSIFTAGLKLHPSLHNIAQTIIKRK